jgi:HEAT repeat protein
MTALATAFAHPDPSVRLNAALQAGVKPATSDLETLVSQCAVEPDFQVREMLTWAIIRLPVAIAVPRVVAELDRPEPQARSQALHTLSKFRDPASWPAVVARLDDSSPAVVRTAWYAAVAVAPADRRDWLARRLGEELGRGDPDARRSLSRALASLGEETIAPVLAAAAQHADAAVRQHAGDTQRLLDDPDAGFSASLKSARREVALGRTRSAKG